MPYSGFFDVDMAPVFVDLDNIQGAYVNEPGETPFIALNVSLKDKQDPTASIIYHALLAFHRSLPEVYRLFPLTQFYEDLPQATPEPSNIIMIGKYRPQRCWTCGSYDKEYRLVGR